MTVMPRKRPLDASDDDAMSAKRPLTSAMRELRIGPPSSPQDADSGAPFGTRNRHRVATRVTRARSPLQFGRSFKRALESAVSEDEQPSKRSRGADSRAVVVYRPSIVPKDLLRRGDAWLAAHMPVRTVPSVVVEHPEDVTEPLDGDCDMDVTDVVVADCGDVVPSPSRALVPLESASARRRGELAQRSEPLVRTQNVILAPWHDDDRMEE